MSKIYSAFRGTGHLMLIILGILSWTYWAHGASDQNTDCSYRLVRYQSEAGKIAWGMDVEMKDDIPSRVIFLDPELGLEMPESGNEIFSKSTWIRLCSATRIARKAPGIFADQTVNLKREQILAPIPQPKNIVAVGLNYRDHQEEVDQGDSVYFPKNIPITGPYAPIDRPNGALLDWEVELGIVIRKEIPQGVKLNAENIDEYIAGFVVTNDVTNRIPIIADTDKGFTKGKTETSFLPVGPYFVPIENFNQSVRINPKLDMSLTINGEQRQAANSQSMVNEIPAILQAIYKEKDALWTDAQGKEGPLLRSKTLVAGDLILTGTPSGTAIKSPDLGEKLGLAMSGMFNFMNPRDVFKQNEYCSGKYLRSGDLVSAKIEGLGAQDNLVREQYQQELAVDCRDNGRKLSRLLK